MLRSAKSIFWLVTLWAGVQGASAFSFLGPPPASGSAPDGYQQPVISYNLPGEIGNPKNFAEEYRWNTKTLVYAFDTAFLDYFGSNGVIAVEQAVAILNALTNFSSYSQDLSEFPLEATRENYQAGALNLMDLKTAALGFMVEELGLADPDRFTWCLRDRRTLPNLPCPFMHYDVIMRNWDPITTLPSSYVNGTLYSYEIVEFCTGPDPLADAVEFPVDTTAKTSTAVAAFAFGRGDFYTGLTRDDVGGLRAMLRTNNMNWESVSSDSVLIRTNLTVNQLLVTSNLALLVSQSLTNDAAALAALFPNLVISGTTSYFTNVVTTNITAYYTNLPWSPAGSPPTLVLRTDYTTNVATYYNHSFANVVTNTYATNGIIRLRTTTVGPCLYGPPGLICTNNSWSILSTNAFTGDYYILPTNSCGASIVATQLVTVTVVTNELVAATNAATSTNTSSTNVIVQQFSQTVFSYFTNYYLVVHPVDCLTNTVALRQGMDTFKFIRANYDSLLGRFFQPVTNRYTLVAISNSTPYVETFERVVTRPDFLFQAEERMAPDEAWHSIGFRTDPGRGNGYVVANIQNPNNVDGPGTREPFIEIMFNKVGPMLINTGPYFLSELQAFPSFVWGSFDGSTNVPVVYPSYRSMTDLENQILIQLTPSGPALPSSTSGVAYNLVFTVTGGQPPYTWSVTPGSAGPPPGLILSPGGVLSGVPTQVGTYDFTLRLSDSGARFVDRAYTLIINAP